MKDDNEKAKFILGLDVGISSVGWAIVDLDEQYSPYKIKDLGVRIFTAAEVPKTGDSKAKSRREKRGIRRLIRRKAFRMDRVRYLLNQNGFLGEKITEGKVDIINRNLEQEATKIIENYNVGKNITPYELKVKALTEKLLKEEILIVMLHYAKHRGYKSNREDNEAAKESSSESGKTLSAINDNRKIMIENNYEIVSELFLKDTKFKDRIRNTNNDYKMCVTREMYLEEINKVLDKQISLGSITTDLKDEFIRIWSDQRHYSKGPGGNSKYGGDLIERMVGKCQFTLEPRAPKCAPSSEIFVSVSKLVNLRYKQPDDKEYKSLNESEITIAINLSKEQDKVTYKKLIKELNLPDNTIIKGLELTKKDFIDFIVKFKKDVLNREDKEKVDKAVLTEEETLEYDKRYFDKLNSKTCLELKSYSIMRKAFIKQLGTDKWNGIKDNFDLLDEFARLLTYYKLNEEIKRELDKIENLKEEYKDVVISMPTFKDHLSISLSLVKSLIPLISSGMRYDEAMNELGYNHSDLNEDIEKYDLLVSLNKGTSINNQRVMRSLAQTRKVVNAVIKKYGLPYQINVETARELAKSRQERNEIEKKQKENQENNEKIKNDLVDKFPNIFSDISKVSGIDIQKYKLWIEQNETCAYSLEKIAIEKLFDKNEVQIDHILPYSRTMNDNYSNRTLVLTKANQEKGNRTPYEWFGKTNLWQNFENFINNINISTSKKDNYLLINLTQEVEQEMRDQNLNDTKYISRHLSTMIKKYLNVEKFQMVSGSITGRLRARWGLNNLTHSLISPTYYQSEKNKDREHHLHHAMDALVIAVTTPSLIQKVSHYEKFRRYIVGKTETEIRNVTSDEIFNFYETGEVLTFREYLNKTIEEKYLFQNKKGTMDVVFPLPYDNFLTEAKLRVYERNEEILKRELLDLKTYSRDEMNNAKVIIPSFMKIKPSGAYHAETFYGIKKIEDSTYKIEKKKVTSLKRKNLEDIVEKNGGSKEVYNTLVEWFGDNEEGEEVFKQKGYPINKKSGNLIKAVRLQEEYKGKGHIINGAVVAKDSIYQIEVYKKDDSDKLYFVGLDNLEIKKAKKGIDFNIALWYGQGNNKVDNISYKKVNEEYIKLVNLKKNELIEIELKNCAKGMGYVTGFTSGMFEISSPIGDGSDLIYSKLFGSIVSQYRITISGIKNIRFIKISVLGKIE